MSSAKPAKVEEVVVDSESHIGVKRSASGNSSLDIEKRTKSGEMPPASTSDADEEFEYGPADDTADDPQNDWIDTYEEERQKPKDQAVNAFDSASLPSAVRRVTASSSSALCLARQMVASQEMGVVAGFTCDFVEDNAFRWTVQLTGFSPDSRLFKDLQALTKPSVDLHLDFAADFPFSPPKVRIVRPRLEGDFVFDGALCMELLMDGWKSSYSMEAVFVHIMATLVEGNAVVTRDVPYTQAMVDSARRRLLQIHARGAWGDKPRS
jgi:ubiquitin-conjugating enzyme E2 Q